MVIEDVIVFVEEFKNYGDIKIVFYVYYKRRVLRVFKVQNFFLEIVCCGLKGESGVEELIGECYVVLREGY